MIDYWDKAKKHLSKRDKILGAIIKSYQGEIMGTRGDAFYTLARSIIGQQISVKAADSVWKKFEAAMGKKITPAKVLAADEPTLRACGLSGAKVKYLYALASHFKLNKKTIANWPHMSDDEIIKELTSINGIGRWTVEMFLMFHLARPDVFPIKDIGIQKAMFRHYYGSKKVPLHQLETLAEGWQPYRTVASWYLWRSLDPVPVAY